MSKDLNKPEIIDASQVDYDYDYMRQDAGGMITAHNGVADRLLSKNENYIVKWKAIGNAKGGTVIKTSK